MTELPTWLPTDPAKRLFALYCLSQKLDQQTIEYVLEEEWDHKFRKDAWEGFVELIKLDQTQGGEGLTKAVDAVD